MANKLIGRLVVAIDLPNGGRMYRDVGALFEMEKNDPNKGPGFSISLDRWFNPAGIGSGPNLNISVYHPDERRGRAPTGSSIERDPVPADVRRPPGTPLDPKFQDDDIPF